VTVVNWPIGRLLLSYFANIYARKVTGLPIADATGGYKCFRREVLEAIDLDCVESNGYTFQIEMSFRAWKKGFRLGEIPIVFVDRDVGQSKMSKAIAREAVWRVLRLRWLSIIGRLEPKTRKTLPAPRRDGSPGPAVAVPPAEERRPNDP
jgi:dolichol-phosphate mannosyltransferase